MEEKQNNNAFSSLIQYVIVGVLPFVFFRLYDTRAIQESMMPLDCLLCNWFSRLIQLKLCLCSNSVFLILLSNVIICCLLVSSGLLRTPSKSCEFCKEYAIDGQNLEVQIAGEPCWIEEKYSVHQHERQDEVDYIYNKSIRKEGKKSMFAESARACELCLTENFEEESKRDEMMAVVPYQSTLANSDEEELKKRCDEFIANFRRQMRLQSGYS